MSSLRFPLRLAALIAAGAGISACDISGLGVGNRPEKLEIVRSPSLASQIDPAGNVIYRCFPDQLQAVLTFSDGAVDASTSLNERVVWKSQDPSVVEVGNSCSPLIRQCPEYPEPGSGVPLPDTTDGGLFGPAELIPRSVGKTTVSAEFVGFTAEYEVEVREIDSVLIDQNALRLAPETSGQLRVFTNVDGFELDVSSNLAWTTSDDDSEPEDRTLLVENASPSSQTIPGRVIALKLGGPFKVRAEPLLCKDEAEFRNLEATIQVEPLVGLQIEREFVNAPNGELIVDTSEALKVTGAFADGATIDLTGQVRTESSDSTIVGASLFFPSTVSAAKAGTAQIKVIYGGDDNNDEEGDIDPPEVQSNSLTFNSVDGELQDFSIAPLNQTITALGRQQFTAMGTFSVAGATRTQPITRAVRWQLLTLDDKTTSAATILTSGSSIGTAISASPEAGAFKVTGTVKIGDEDVVKNTVLCVKKPNTPTAACPPPEEEEEAP